MKKVSSGKIKLNAIKHIENSRLREKTDVADLMHDIEQRGLMHNVGIRKGDNALIYGNRRVKAFEKLGYEEIPCDFYEDIDDEELLIANLAENIKTKSIGTIEIGRICKILQSKGMTQSEISERLGITKSRVMSSVSAYNVTIGTPFEKLVIYGKLGHGRKGIPESLIWKIHEGITRAKVGRKITKEEWEVLLRAAEKGELNSHNVSMLRAILLSDDKMTIVKALGILDKTKVIYAYFSADRKVLSQCMRKEKIDSEKEFIRHIVKQYNSSLIF